MRTRSRSIVIPLFAAVATSLLFGGIGSASTPAKAPESQLTLVSFSQQTAQAREACQADGATVATAMAAFEAQHPGTAVTAHALVERWPEGQYLTNWPNNPGYYRFSIKSGVLKLAVLKFVGPPFVYSNSTKYVGPQSCSSVRAFIGTQRVLQAVAACQADGATVSTAMAAFHDQNPGVRPTAHSLVTGTNEGPYIQSWPYNPAYYRFSIKDGVLEISIVTSHGPPATFSTPSPYKGPQDCSFG